MKTVLIAAFLPSLVGAVLASPMPGQQEPESPDLNWRAWARLPNQDINSLEVSVAVGPSGDAHFAQFCLNGNEQRYDLYYFNTRYESRSSAVGFSSPLLKDFGLAGDSIAGPDIWVDSNNKTHIVWGHGFNNASPRHGRIGYLNPDEGDVVWLTIPEDRQYHNGPQVVVTPEGDIHVVSQLSNSGPAPWNNRIMHIVRTTTGQNHENVLYTPPNDRGIWPPRIAVRGNKLCVVWQESHTNGTDIYYSQATYDGGGSTTWSAVAPVTAATGLDKFPDVDFDGANPSTPHFAWSRVPIGFPNPPPPRIMYAKLGLAATEVSEPTTNPDLYFGDGARVRIDDNDGVHVFYDGFSHASKDKGSNTWKREQPLKAPKLPDDTYPQTSCPHEVAHLRGRFDLVDNQWYIRTFNTIPDGASWVPVIPGGQVNIVPLNGNFQYRVDLFGTNGVGPSASLGMTYTSKQTAASLIGQGWTMDHLMYITVPGDDQNITLTLPNGLSLNFTFETNVGYTIADNSFGFVASIRKLQSTWSMLVDGGTEYIFNSFGKLGTVFEKTGHRIDVLYDATGRPDRIVDMLGPGFDAAGRTTYLTYGTALTANRLVLVTDPAGSQYQLNYEATTSGIQLASVVFLGIADPLERPTFKFEYGTNGMMSKVIPPAGVQGGNYGYSIAYDSAGRVEKIEDPTEIYISENGTEIQARAALEIHYNKDHATVGQGTFHSRVKDRRGNSTVQVFDVANNFAAKEIWDPAALAGMPGVQPIRRSYDAFGNVTLQRDRWGAETVYTYVQKNLTDPAPWLRNLIQTVSRPHPSGSGTELTESFTYTQDDFGNIETHTTYSSTAGGARTTTYFYDNYGRVRETHFPSITLPDGNTQNAGIVINEYQGPHLQLSRTINEEGNWTEFSDFDPDHGLPRKSLQQGGTQYEETLYDFMGNVTRTKSAPGGPDNEEPGWTINELDGLYRIVSITDPAGRITVNTYDVESRRIIVQPPAGGPTQTEYDRRGFVRGGSSADGSWFQRVDGNGNVRMKSNLRGFVSQTQYDSIDRAIQMRVPGGTGSGFGGGTEMITEWLHDGFVQTPRKLFKRETRRGPTPDKDRITETEYDHRGRIIRVTGADNKSKMETFFDEQDQVIAQQASYDDAFQTCVVTFRDERDRVSRVRVQGVPYPSVPPATLQLTTLTFHNKAGSVTRTVDPEGRSISYVLDARQRISHVIDGLGNVVEERHWGNDDLLVEVRVPDPVSKSASAMVTSERRAYTKRKELLFIRNRDGVGITHSYGLNLNQIESIRDAANNITQITYYEDTQRVKDVILASNSPSVMRVTTNVWQAGLLTETRVYNPATGVNDAIYGYSYDQADRLERFVSPLIAPQSHFYNEFGELRQLDQGLETTVHDYNILGQRTITSWSGPRAGTETRAYNSGGFLESVTAVGRQRFQDYIIWRGMASVESWLIGGTTWKIQTTDYDRANNLIQLIDGQGVSHQWVYDANNRVTELYFAEKKICEITYTPGGLLDRTRYLDTNGINVIAETIFFYDGLGRRVRQQTSQPSTSRAIAEYEWEYNIVDLATKIHIKHLGVTSTVTYNERWEVTGDELSGNADGAAVPPFTNPPLGNLAEGQPRSDWTSEVSEVPALLPTVTPRVATWTYDRAGNRQSQTIDGVVTTYSYNSASQLTGESTPSSETTPSRTVSHFYDEWGNEFLRATAQGTVTTDESFIYNYLNFMSAYTNTTTGTTREYHFWPTGERYAKINSATDESELYIYRGNDVIGEYQKNPLPGQPGEYTIDLKNSYVQGISIDSKYTRISAAGDRRHYIGDMIGTVGMTLTDAGSPVETSVKDVWGVQVYGTANERYGFAQREHDFESGLVHMRARMYDPKIGRFTQTDPLRANRSQKHYVYASNNPVARIDPRGSDDIQEHHIFGLVRKNERYEGAWRSLLSEGDDIFDPDDYTKPLQSGKGFDHSGTFSRAHTEKSKQVIDRLRAMKESGNSIQEMRKYAIEEMLSFHDQHSIGVNDLKRYGDKALAGSNDLKLADLAHKAGVDFEKTDSLKILGSKASAAGRKWASKFVKILDAINDSKLVKLLRRIPGVKYAPAVLTGAIVIFSDKPAEAKAEMVADALDPTPGLITPTLKRVLYLQSPESLRAEVRLLAEYIPGLHRMSPLGFLFDDDEVEELEDRERLRYQTHPNR